MQPALKPSLETDEASAKLEWSTTSTSAGSATVFRTTVRNAGTTAFRARQARMEFSLPHDSRATALRIAYCGAHSSSPHSRSDVRSVGDGAVESWWVGARSGAGGGIVVGALDFTRWVSAFYTTADSMVAVQWLEDALVRPSEELVLPDLWVATTGGAPLVELEQFAQELARRHDVQTQDSPCGWGSWGQYSERIDEGLVRETMLALEGTPHFRDVVNVIQIDDGWAQMLDNARVCSTWQPNERFAWGIAPLAARLTGGERRTGLWLLPFTANEGSPVIAEHPDYLVAGADRQPLRAGGGSSYVFDPTLPAAAAELRRTFRRLGDWGIRYVKLDFLRALLAPDPIDSPDDLTTPRRYAAGVTRSEAYRAGLGLVREAVGRETFVLGCSSPLGSGVGILDAQRIGPDMEPEWTGRRAGIRDCARAVAANWFWQGRAWVNDPDYLVTGQSVHESRFWAAAVALSGGSAILSVDLEEMEAWREDLLAFVTPPSGRSARPLDLFESLGEPNIWHLPCSIGAEKWSVVGLFNWGDSGRDIAVSLSALGVERDAHVWDVWRRSYSFASKSFQVNVQGRDARFLVVRAVEPRPCVVGSDIHFTNGERELSSVSWDGSALKLLLAPGRRFRDGTLTIWSPPTLEPTGDRGRFGRGFNGWLLDLPWTMQTGAVTLEFVRAR